MASHYRIVRFPEVKTLTGLGRSSIYRKMADGTFPQRVKIGPNCIGWRLPDILAWLADPR